MDGSFLILSEPLWSQNVSLSHNTIGLLSICIQFDTVGQGTNSVALCVQSSQLVQRDPTGLVCTPIDIANNSHFFGPTHFRRDTRWVSN